MAAKFRDAHDDEWVIKLNVAVLKRLKQHEIDLVDLVNTGNIIERFYADPVLLVDAIYLCCQDEAERRNVNDEEFGRRIANGEVLDAATQAMFEGVADFFSRRGAVLLRASQRIRALEARALAQADSELDSLEAKEMSALGLTSGEPSTSAPASSA